MLAIPVTEHDLTLFIGMVLSSPITDRIKDELGKVGLLALDKLRSNMSERLGKWLAGKLTPNASSAEQQKAIETHLAENPDSIKILQALFEDFSEKQNALIEELIKIFQEQQKTEQGSLRNYDFKGSTIGAVIENLTGTLSITQSIHRD